ncbi:MAG: class I SAM-dependent RNA methyltransferase [Candidatus Cloacimonetes bacterium]|nr:class I SAM-dependent RNA methyltransferase [Candidatus Cloacimonadota bacterium]
MRINDLNGFAQGVGRFEEGEHQGMVGFVPHTLPGDIIEPKTIEFQKRIGLVKTRTILTKSQLRGETHCNHAGVCPGCSLHSMQTKDYKSLKAMVLNSLLRGPLKNQNMPLICLNQTGFRNKIILHWNDSSQSLAYSDESSYSDITQCPIAEKPIQNIISQLPKALKEISGVHKIYIKSLPGDQTILGIICKLKPVVEDLKSRLSHLSDSIFWQYDNTPFTIDRYQWIQGGETPFYEEVLTRPLFWLPESFFQTNRPILNEIVKTLRQWIKPQTIVWDLFCGIGTLLFGIQEQIQSGYGVEFGPEAIECARNSALQVKNLNFACLDLTKEIHKIPKNWEKPGLILLNPPRQGISPKLIKRLLEMNCQELIYMSCNPITLERDLKPLLQSGYSLKQSLAFDMFPNTAHFEILTHLKKGL